MYRIVLLLFFIIIGRYDDTIHENKKQHITKGDNINQNHIGGTYGHTDTQNGWDAHKNEMLVDLYKFSDRKISLLSRKIDISDVRYDEWQKCVCVCVYVCHEGICLRTVNIRVYLSCHKLYNHPKNI